MARSAQPVTTPLPPRVDGIRWDLLSEQSTAILRQVLIPIHEEGYSVREVAKRLDIPERGVRLLTEFFAWEVSLQSHWLRWASERSSLLDEVETRSRSRCL